MSTAVAPLPKRRIKPAPGKPLARITCIGPDQAIHVPAWVCDLASFRSWADSDEYPEKARILYLHGEIWMDLTMEQAFTHNAIKTESTIVLGTLAKRERRDLYFSDGMRLSSVTADLSAGPDGMFVTYATLQSGRARLVPGKVEGFVEIEGAADMVLEVISASSVKKDLEVLRDLYWQAGIEEYWLIDARGDNPVFEILRHGDKGYVGTRKRDGWVKSIVFGKSFKLTRVVNEHGHPEFTLHVK